MAPSILQLVGFLLATLLIAPIQVLGIASELDIIPDAANPETPIPEEIILKLRTLMNVTNEYEKRSAQARYGCRGGEYMSRAACVGNTIYTYCKPFPGWVRTGSDSSEKVRSKDPCEPWKACANNMYGSSPPKAGCRPLDAMSKGYISKGGGKMCSGINAAWAQDMQIRVGTVVYSDVGAKTGYEPDQITLTDGDRHMVQAVGAADIKEGHFISKYFKYIGGIDECVYGKVSFDTPALSWYSYVTSF